MRSAALTLILAGLFALTSAPAGASTIVYQCNGAICAKDPDSAGKPRTVTASGRLAGITADGNTVSWVDPAGKLVRAPVSGRAPKPIAYAGQVVNQPSMSPDGSRYLWWYEAIGAVWINRLEAGATSVDGVSYCGGCVTTHGWLGRTAIAAFPGDALGRQSPSTVCSLASRAERPDIRGSCVQRLVSDARGGIGFPNGNSAATELVGVLTPGELTGVRGRIVRYSLATGAPIGDVTSGTDATTPVFSPEGDRVAFERGGRIVVRTLASGAERVIGSGVYPHWGGVRVQVAGTLRARTLARRRALIRVGCGGACRISATLTVSRTTARRLGLGRSRTLARASGSRKSPGTATLGLRPEAKARARLGRVRSYRATLTTSVKGAAGTPSRSSASVRVRR